MKEIFKIQGIQKLNKKVQKEVIGGGGPTEYLEYCGPGSDGANCLTGLPHCPYGICATGVCSPLTGGH